MVGIIILIIIIIITTTTTTTTTVITQVPKQMKNEAAVTYLHVHDSMDSGHKVSFPRGLNL
jgi:hypothetical protein